MEMMTGCFVTGKKAVFDVCVHAYAMWCSKQLFSLFICAFLQRCTSKFQERVFNGRHISSVGSK